ncbi:response regulator [Ectopseudomonas oleovorans]|uniref:response regulator n=1 Tax=Ectopseudomonas oleovorans TaxID=301 RepID=UPI001FCE7BCE|nr:response regulator [Pseudomonas oleovorans]
MRVESTEGQGSCFSIELPLRAGKRLASQQRAVLPELGRLNILAADDVPQNLELLQLTLEHFGHRVHCVADGEGALQAFTQQRFDLILMDVQMPGVDGLEASRRIRQLEAAEAREPIPIIALTASVLDQDRQAALDSGMNGFASKPLDLNALLWEVARLLGLTDVPGAVVSATRVAADGLFDWVRGSSLWGGPLRMAQAINTFIGEQHDLAVRLSRLLAARDWQEGEALAHRLHGAAANLAMSSLATLGQSVERAFQVRDEQALPALIVELEQALLTVKDVVPQVPDTASTSESSAVDARSLREQASQLRHALQRGGLDDEVLAAMAQTTESTAYSAALNDIRQALDDFDFDQALQVLDRLLLRLQDEDATAS